MILVDVLIGFEGWNALQVGCKSNQQVIVCNDPNFPNSHHKIHKSKNKKQDSPGTYSGGKHKHVFMEEIGSSVYVMFQGSVENFLE